jgi:hypothetical protein
MSDVPLRQRLMNDLLEKIQGLEFIAGPPAAAVIAESDISLQKAIAEALSDSLSKRTGTRGSGLCVAISARYRMADGRLLIARVVLSVIENTSLNRGANGTKLDAGDVALQLLIDLEGWAPSYFSNLHAPDRGEQLSLVLNEPGRLIYEVVFETVTQL